MAGFQTPVVQATMNAAGTANGYISVPDNSRFVVGADAWLKRAGGTFAIVITELSGTNLIGCRLDPGSIIDQTAGNYPGPNYGRSDLSAFASGDTITMPAQFVADATAPVIPPVALLADITSASATLNDTGIIDVSSYTALAIMVVPSGGTETAFNMYWVDDAGNFILAGTIATPTASAQKSWGLGVVNGINGPLPRRVRFTSGSIAAQTTRILVYGDK
jgi:hypothetical protein